MSVTNRLLTGPPRSGKTTTLERTISRLREDGYAISGLSSPEIRENGERVGFELVDIASGEREVMAHVDFDDGPRIGSYRVDVSAVDRLSQEALPVGLETADCLVIDEIAPMQLESEQFIRETERALESSTPVLAAIKLDDVDDVLSEIKARGGTELVRIEPETRDAVTGSLCAWVRSD